MTAGLPLMKNVLTPLAKRVLVTLRLTTVSSAADAAIQKKIFGSGKGALVFSNEDLNDIMRKVKSFEESDLLIKGVFQTIKNETKNKKMDFLV